VRKITSNSPILSFAEGLLEAGHSVRVRRLYFNAKFPTESYHHHTFHATLNPEEYKSYVEHNKPTASDAGDENMAAEVREAVEDLRWCNAIVFVFPTW
jgi:putative NADPH-quinone reductase